jgi:hypothetical protein
MMSDELISVIDLAEERLVAKASTTLAVVKQQGG